jgi:hypothetical protein
MMKDPIAATESGEMRMRVTPRFSPPPRSDGKRDLPRQRHARATTTGVLELP